MSSFETTKSQFVQDHFEIIAIDLPAVTGTCTFEGGSGYGTPRTCDQATNATATYKFTNDDAPLLPHNTGAEAGGIFRCIKSISETPTKIKPGKGLAARGTLSIKFTDFLGDPNPDAPGVTDDVKAQGTFFGKLAARNNLVNAELRLRLYRVEFGGGVDIPNGDEKRTYIISSITNDGRGVWTIKAKDQLSVVNFDDYEWPPANDYSIKNDITNSVTTFAVSTTSIIAAGNIIRIGEELMKVSSVANIGTASATITVGTRGNDISKTNFLSKTTKDEHDAGDEIFICDYNDDERIDAFLKRVLIAAGVPTGLIPIADWIIELDQWLAGITLNTIWTEADDVTKVVSSVLNDFLLDMWFDPVDEEVKLSAINVWKSSSRVLTEGVEIDFKSIKVVPVEELRASRAVVVYNKPNLTASDDLPSFTRVSIFTDPTLETADEYGKPKAKTFQFSHALTKVSADVLVQRYVSRFGQMPLKYKWKTQERNLVYKTGDIVNINSDEKQGYDGLPDASIRAQILAIKPSYSKGREYAVEALTFESAIDTTPGAPPSGSFTLIGNIIEANLFVQAGAPGIAVDVTFILDAATVSSTSVDIASIVAGAFVAGSTITIIMINGTDWQGKGGRGGSTSDGYSGLGVNVVESEYGGLCYDAQGVTTDIYFSGAAPDAHTADGYLRAPGGGGGYGGYWESIPPKAKPLHGGAGGGGCGINVGVGFADGDTIGNGGAGGTGKTSGSFTSGDGGAGGDWGQAGQSGDPGTAGNQDPGGAAGRGIIKNGATVTIYGDTPTRFINGTGDTI